MVDVNPVKFNHTNANDIMKFVRELRIKGLVQGIDFDFRLDTFSNTITFYFKEEIYATFYRIKFTDYH